MIIFGVDPGLNKTGIGILGIEGKKLHYLDHSVIKTSAGDPLSKRLKTICEGIDDLIGKYTPSCAAVEDIFYSVNIKSAMLLGQTRGAIIATLLNKKIEVNEFTALQIKKAVVGYGKADKEQVKKMVELMLKIDLKKSFTDASDALACAICLGLNLTGFRIQERL